jgi:hypothetical protein
LSGFSTAAVRVVDDKPTAVPVRDGSRYATWDYDFRPGQLNTTIEVKNSLTGAVVYSVVLDGFARNLRPSPTAAQLLLITWSTSATTNDPEEVIVDLARRTVVETLGGANAAANWFSNGSYLLLQPDGTLLRANPGAPRSTVGRVSVAGRSPRGLWISPDDSELLMLWRTEQEQEILKDLWVSDVNGNSLNRLTVTNQSDNPVWSHDGRFIAYRNFAEQICTGFSCPTASCEIQYASSASRGLAIADTRATDFRVVNSSGSTTVTLGCELNGWTP